jgi:hypothetical protein
MKGKKKRYEQQKHSNPHRISVLMPYWSAEKAKKERAKKQNKHNRKRAKNETGKPKKTGFKIDLQMQKRAKTGF